jgi:hypothetical protein
LRALVEKPGFDEPVDRVAPSIGRGRATDGAGCQDNLTAAGPQVLGDLAARLAAAHHEHAALGQQPGTAVVGGVVLRDPVGERPGQRRYPRHVLGARGGHDGAGTEVTVTSTRTGSGASASIAAR